MNDQADERIEPSPILTTAQVKKHIKASEERLSENKRERERLAAKINQIEADSERIVRELEAWRGLLSSLESAPQ